MADLNSDEKSALKYLLDGGVGHGGVIPETWLSLKSKGLVRMNFGGRGARHRRMRRGVIWNGRWELVNPDEARALLAVEALEDASREGGVGEVSQKAIFKGGSFKVSMAIKGFEAGPSTILPGVSDEIAKAVGLHFDSKSGRWIAKP